MKVALRVNGKYIGVDPATGLQFPVYTNRTSAGEWEELLLTAHGGGLFDLKFIAANRQLTLTPAGGLESRMAGAVGVWEQFFITTQPEFPQGPSLLYRYESGVIILPVLQVESRD